MSPSKKKARKKKAERPAAPSARAVEDRERDDFESRAAEDREPDERGMWNAAETGRDRLDRSLEEHTSTGPELTAGDIDANWESAEAVGDEAPGGHMPTPDQDVVDEIGAAVGLPAEGELHASEEVLTGRDRRRWELDRLPGDEGGRTPRRRPEIEEVSGVSPLDDIIEVEDLEEDEPLRNEPED